MTLDQTQIELLRTFVEAAKRGAAVRPDFVYNQQPPGTAPRFEHPGLRTQPDISIADLEALELEGLLTHRRTIAGAGEVRLTDLAFTTYDGMTGLPAVARKPKALHVEQSADVPFESLLHPVVRDAALHHFHDEDWREAALNAMIAVFDLLRTRTNLDLDGSQLATEALSLDHPKLIISTLRTESGKNEQKGMMMLLQGAFIGIRNPKAHTLNHESSREVAAQYMIFASLLARRISEATSAT